MRRFVLQMAGESGTGKSTLALAVGRATGAVVLDKDRIKPPLMESGLQDPLAGGMAYDVFWKLADHFLAQHFSVVLDSAAFYERVVAQGRRLAEAHDVLYRLVECVCSDERMHAGRLLTCSGLVSQPANLATVVQQRANPARSVLTLPHLVVDTTQPLDTCVERALGYLQP